MEFHRAKVEHNRADDHSDAETRRADVEDHREDVELDRAMSGSTAQTTSLTTWNGSSIAQSSCLALQMPSLTAHMRSSTVQTSSLTAQTLNLTARMSSSATQTQSLTQMPSSTKQDACAQDV